MTTPDVAKHVDLRYRTLHSWIEDGLIVPAHRPRGTGRANLLDRAEVIRVCALADLWHHGFDRRILGHVATALRDQPVEDTNALPIRFGAHVLNVDVSLARAVANALGEDKRF